MGIVDSHVHVFAADAEPYPWHPLSPIRPDVTVPVESLIATMDAAGVDHAVIIQHSCYGYDNRYILDCAKTDPARFCAVVKVHPLAPESPDVLRRLALDHGAQGLRLQTTLDPQANWLDSPDTFPLWQAAADLGMVVGILLDPPQMGQAETIIQRFPQVKVIIDHIGRVDVGQPPEHPYFQTLLGLSRFPNTYVKLSGFYALSRQPYPYLDLQPHVAALWDAFGPQRLMWATDFPLLVRAGEPYEAALNIFDHHLPSATPEEREWLMGQTALSLFRFANRT